MKVNEVNNSKQGIKELQAAAGIRDGEELLILCVNRSERLELHAVPKGMTPAEYDNEHLGDNVLCRTESMTAEDFTEEDPGTLLDMVMLGC